MLLFEQLARVGLEALLAASFSLLFFLIALPSKIGSQIVGSFFDKKLEAFKSKHAAEVEQLKEKLANQTDRGKHSNDLEFAALTSAWEAYADANLATLQCAASCIEYPDFNRLIASEIDAWLSSSELSEQQRAAIRSSNDKNKAYTEIMKGRIIAEAAHKIFNARQVLRRRSVFITKELTNLFDTNLNICSDVQAEQSVNFSMRNFNAQVLRDSTSKFYRQNNLEFDTLRDAVRQRTLRIALFVLRKTPTASIRGSGIELAMLLSHLAADCTFRDPRRGSAEFCGAYFPILSKAPPDRPNGTTRLRIVGARAA